MFEALIVLLNAYLVVIVLTHGLRSSFVQNAVFDMYIFLDFYDLLK
jgi:hypothetical protein